VTVVVARERVDWNNRYDRRTGKLLEKLLEGLAPLLDDVVGATVGILVRRIERHVKVPVDGGSQVSRRHRAAMDITAVTFAGANHLSVAEPAAGK
jgi:hypothetical protein